MRGFSSGFPRRGAGVGLLVLRAVVGLRLLVESIDMAGPAWWLRMLLIVLALLLLLGMLTPVAGAAGAVHQLACLVDATPAQMPQLALAAMTALAVVLLGPGAYSGDARLFGRRRLVLPGGQADQDGRPGRDHF
jgi:hypothetical protein